MKVQQSKFKKQNDAKLSQSQLKTGSKLFNEKYMLCQMIGKGSFGEVYRGVFTINHSEQDASRYPKFTAIKVENDLSKASQIVNQINVLNSIFRQNKNVEGFPKIHASGIQSGHAFMIMDLLGPNLQDLMMLCGGKFSLKTSLLLIIQIFERIEILHELGFVYRDIKPQNFVMGIGKNSKDVFMVDFGLTKRFRDQNTRLFLPYKESVSMVGTIRYSSLNSHLGIDQTRRDDLQSICYMLIYFLKGQLPWQGLAFEHKFEKDHMIMDCKLKLSPSKLCKNLPEEISNVFQYIKGLDYYQDPDYRFIISELTYIFENKCEMIDFQYDWQKLPNNAKLQKTTLEISFPKEPNLLDNDQSEMLKSKAHLPEKKENKGSRLSNFSALKYENNNDG